MADQREAGRTDVLTYATEPLTEAVRIGGAPVANLVASTSGTDSDWVVKLIDVIPTNSRRSRRWVDTSWRWHGHLPRPLS